jgi:hypothetical protein
MPQTVGGCDTPTRIVRHWHNHLRRKGLANPLEAKQRREVLQERALGQVSQGYLRRRSATGLHRRSKEGTEVLCPLHGQRMLPRIYCSNRVHSSCTT